jgi:branched-chain amino acid transport system substrate-binding protein
MATVTLEELRPAWPLGLETPQMNTSKRVRTRQTTGVAVAACLTLLAAGCGGGSSDGPAANELVIGTIMPLSGPQEALSNSYLAMKAYFDAVNASGGIDGVKIKLVAKDDQFNPVNTPAAARALVEQDEAQMLCANQGSGTFSSIRDYLTARSIGSVPMTGESRLFTEAGTGFQLLTPYELTAATLVRHAVDELGMTKVAIAYTDDGIGQPFKAGAEHQLSAMGLSPVAVVQVNASATDQAPAAAKLAESGAEIVLFNHVAPVVSQVVRASKRVGFTPTWALTYAALNQQVLDLSEGALNGHAVFATPFADHDDPALSEYRSAMTAENPKVDATDFLSVEGWVAGSVCADVIERAVESADGVPTNEQLLTALGSSSIDTDLVQGLNWSADTRLGSTDLRIVSATGGGFSEVAGFATAPAVPLGE